jgi:mRNA interferase MazF
MSDDAPLRRGEVAWVEFDPVRGHEQAGRRPALVISTDAYHASIPNLAVVVPVTTRDRGLPHHVPLSGAHLRLPSTSYAMTEQPRSIDRDRVVGTAGRVDEQTLDAVDRALDRFLISGITPR